MTLVGSCVSCVSACVSILSGAGRSSKSFDPYVSPSCALNVTSLVFDSLVSNEACVLAASAHLDEHERGVALGGVGGTSSESDFISSTGKFTTGNGCMMLF